MFESEFKAVTVNSIKNELTKRNVSVITLMKFYDKSKIVIYKVIGSVIYTIVDNCICLDCLDFSKRSYRNMTITLKTPSSKIYTMLGILEILMNIILCHGFTKSSISTVIFFLFIDIFVHIRSLFIYF